MHQHVSLGTAELKLARIFSDPAMSSLGLRRTFEHEEAVGYGAGITSISLNLPTGGEPASPSNGVRVAFEVERRAASMPFTKPHSRTAAVLMVYRVFGLSMMRITMLPLSVIPTATRFKL